MPNVFFSGYHLYIFSALCLRICSLDSSCNPDHAELDGVRAVIFFFFLARIVSTNLFFLVQILWEIEQAFWDAGSTISQNVVGFSLGYTDGARCSLRLYIPLDCLKSVCFSVGMLYHVIHPTPNPWNLKMLSHLAEWSSVTSSSGRLCRIILHCSDGLMSIQGCVTFKRSWCLHLTIF